MLKRQAIIYNIDHWVDADTCPIVIKEIIYRSVDRTQMLAVFIAGHAISLSKLKYILIF